MGLLPIPPELGFSRMDPSGVKATDHPLSLTVPHLTYYHIRRTITSDVVDDSTLVYRLLYRERPWRAVGRIDGGSCHPRPDRSP